MDLSSPKINIFPEVKLSSSRFKKLYIFSKKSFSSISGGTSEAPKHETSYTSPKKVMNNFF